ncbi:MAG: T9SS type A sorting domain-containing protein [Cytophagaceae bacterium]|jgi:hypothetical protein|nr:T9SS type A sorting domain-containing protein [Cytophagaceae bacterium]
MFELGVDSCEGYGFGLRDNIYQIAHTNDCGQSLTRIPVDELYVFGQMGSLFPDVYRGGKKGEVYLSSWFPGMSYKVSFSADTGQTFRHVYVCENCNPHENNESYFTYFMSDREPGVFYIFRSRIVVDWENDYPGGEHRELCIEYYRDYGQVLEATFCHNITKDYKYEEAVCENATSLESGMVNNSSVQLQWVASADSSLVRGYHVYRNNVRITDTLVNETVYCDANLPAGEYEYYVKTYHKAGCLPDSSNRVTETVTLSSADVNSMDEITVYPNPTTGELRIEGGVSTALNNQNLRVESVQIFDVFGNNIEVYGNIPSIDITHLSAGVYFVQITTGNRTITKKVIKY